MHTLILPTLIGAAVAAELPPTGHEGHETATDTSKQAQLPGLRMFVHHSAMRIGSGTAWRPAAAPMFGWMGMRGRLHWMAHANLVGAYDLQGSERGGRALVSLNWVMVEGMAEVGRGSVAARAMLSAEPLTLRGDGYPLLGQTGETWQGRPLHDRQHPHELFMELALHARQALSSDVGVELYVAPVGEPALGPVAYPHRTYGFFDPVAPLGHHWQDATHITSSVLTLGMFTEQVKIEGSWFYGKEPDEERLDLDLGLPDSGSGRISFAPTPELVLQVSYGYLAEPEALHPGEPVHRATASVLWDRATSGAGGLAGALVLGRNISHGLATDAALVEGVWSLSAHSHPFARIELTEKSAEDLVLEGVAEDETFLVPSVAVGHLATWEPARRWSLGLGVRANVLLLGPGLEPYYGTRLPAGLLVYGQVRPAAMRHYAAMQHESGQGDHGGHMGGH